MQGRKTFTPKMLYAISLQELVPENNFYRRLLAALDLHWLYKETADYYGMEGQESIYPVVFFNIGMVGYINNIASDRKLIEFCADSLAIRLFVGYDIDESLPWHSTISRTRKKWMVIKMNSKGNSKNSTQDIPANLNCIKICRAP